MTGTDKLAELGARRRALLAEVDEVTEEIRPAALAAISDGAQKLVVSKMTAISRPTIDKWLEQADRS